MKKKLFKLNILVGIPTKRVFMEIIKEYDARLDNKRRITIRSSEYQYYNVKEYSDGHLELQPRILVDPEEISLNTLKMMDNSIENIKKGNVSNPVKLNRLTVRRKNH